MKDRQGTVGSPKKAKKGVWEGGGVRRGTRKRFGNGGGSGGKRRVAYRVKGRVTNRCSIDQSGENALIPRPRIGHWIPLLT